MSWKPVLTVSVDATDWTPIDEYADHFFVLTGYEGEEITENLVERIMTMLKAVGTEEEESLAALDKWLRAHIGRSYFITDQDRMPGCSLK